MADKGKKRFPTATLIWGFVSTPFWCFYFVRLGYSLESVIAAVAFAVTLMILVLTLVWRRANREDARR